jgi:hypothetical protein
MTVRHFKHKAHNGELTNFGSTKETNNALNHIKSQEKNFNYGNHPLKDKIIAFSC